MSLISKKSNRKYGMAKLTRFFANLMKYTCINDVWIKRVMLIIFFNYRTDM